MYDRNVGTKTYQQPGGPPSGTGNQNWNGPAEAQAGVTDAFLLEPPASSDSWDLVAADLSDPDLAASGGWICKLNGAPYTVLTRAGDVQLTGFPGAGTYWSTLLAGRLVMKFPASSAVEIVRPTSGSHVYKAHISPANWDAQLAMLPFVANGNNFNQAGNQIAYAGRANDSSVQGVLHVGPSTFNTIYNIADTASELNVDRVSYITDLGSGARGIGSSFRYANGVYWRAALADIPVTFATTSAGVLLASNNANGPNFFYVDFIRRLPPGSIL